MTTDDFNHVDPVVAAGAQAIRDIVAAREHISRIPRRLAEEWAEASDSELDIATRSRDTSLQEKISLLLLHADLLAVDGGQRSDPKLLKESLRRLYLAGVHIARSKHLSSGVRLAALRMADEIGKHARIPKHFRQEVARRIEDLSTIGVTADWLGFASLTEEVFLDLSSRAQRGATAHPAIQVPQQIDNANTDISAADLLASAAARQASEAVAFDSSLVTYDMSDAEIRLCSINLRGFRGSPGETSLQFIRDGTPVSSIVFGENGVGKSTIVDAIEFALQGRIGRSDYFDSPLAPAVSSLANDDSPWTRAVVSDGTSVERSAILSPKGTLTTHPKEVRPGFRLAPIAIKRSDILRFLDTDSLERGYVLLDYFPADAKRLAVRPEAEAQKLRASITELRIKRSAFAKELADLVNAPSSSLETHESLQKFIKDEIMMGEPQESFLERDGWSGIDLEIISAINRLSQVLTDLTETKKRSEKINQPLNPMTHRAQVQIIKASLEGIGAEVSHAFASIATEHPIESIDVVFGESGPLSLDLVVSLENGRNCFPQQLFSEAYKDLVALLFFVSVAKKASERGQSKILILDDVLQSVDAKIRHALVDYILSEFSDWQLIFTVHDRLWCDQLKDLFESHQHSFIERRIVGWDFSTGPQLMQPNVDSMSKDLRALLSSGEPRVVGALAGQLLESICDQLSWRLQLKITRKNGDRYTLGDLWPVVRDRLLESSAGDLIQRVASHRGLRNITVHADPLSMSLSSVDAQSFGSAVLAMYERLHCIQCRSWVRGSRSPSCSCGTLSL